MTTNHIELLDSALIRPGRVDVKLAFENATSDQAGRLFKRFFPKHANCADAFAKSIESRKFSMATLQDYLMLHRHQPEEAINGAGEIGKLQIAKVASPKTHSRSKPTLAFSALSQARE